jgi:tRNA pseudouridine55 synthase
VPNGILLLDKPLGLSSNAALQRVKGLLGARKAGHVGSLDPLATGMLPLVLEEATKFAGEIISQRKCYRFVLALGARTRTGDTEGEVVESAPVPELSAAAVDAVFADFLGATSQIPPMFSALKRDGQPLYALARAGIEVERAPRPIEILKLVLLSLEPRALEAEVICSKGTYIRTLGEDVARRLGTCGHLAGLRRLYVEPFGGEPMETLETIGEALKAGRWPKLLPADAALEGLPAANLTAEEARRLYHGQALLKSGLEPCGAVRVYGGAGEFIGLGKVVEPGVLQPRRLVTEGASLYNPPPLKMA